MTHVKSGIFFALILGIILFSHVFAAAPSGNSPSDPLSISSTTLSLAPKTTVWFYFDYIASGSVRALSRANVSLDANGVSGIQFGIYTPTQGIDWLRDETTSPIGRGTPYYDTLTGLVVRDLFWSGAFNTSGRYLIAVTNANSVAIFFRLTVTGDTVSLFPEPKPSPTPTLFVPITVTPVPSTTIQGKIIFETATGGDIYTVNGDGTNLNLVSHGIDPAWSPDGKQIIFARWDNSAPGIFIANADGSNEQIVFGAPRTRWPRMSSDGKFIVFSQEKTKVENNIIWKLGVIEIATGKLTEPQCSQLCFVPSWNNDSQTIAFTDPGIGIMTTNIFGGPASLILGPTGSYWDTAANIPRPNLHMPPIQLSKWSSDGKRIVYSQFANDHWDLNVVNADGTNQTGLTRPDPFLYILFGIAPQNVAPTWSPDNQQILFLSDRNGRWEFFVTDPSGANIRQVLKSLTDRISLRFDFENERMVDWIK